MGKKRERAGYGLDGGTVPKQGAKCPFFIKPGRKGALRAPLLPKNPPKMNFFHFATGCPRVRAAGPPVTRSGRKGVETHNGHAEV